jgi:hypothetical protein
MRRFDISRPNEDLERMKFFDISLWNVNWEMHARPQDPALLLEGSLAWREDHADRGKFHVQSLSEVTIGSPEHALPLTIDARTYAKVRVIRVAPFMDVRRPDSQMKISLATFASMED